MSAMPVAPVPRAAASAAELEVALFEMLRCFVARAPLFADLRSRGEADDLVQDALLTVSRRVAEGGVEDPFAYATRVVQNLARHAYARAERRHPAEATELLERIATADVATQVVQRFELAEVLAMVRQVTAVVRELAPGDVELVRGELRRDDQKALAQRLGMSRATFYRRKREVVCRFVGAVAARADAVPCAEHAESLLAAAGGSGFAGAQRARDHAGACDGCRTTLRHLEAARHGLALVSPLPALAEVGDASLAERLTTAAAHAGEWARGVVVRAPDPVALLPSTRGAAAALAAVCLGVGGSTYCAVDGVPRTVRDALGVDHARSHAGGSPVSHGSGAAPGSGASRAGIAVPAARVPAGSSGRVPARVVSVARSRSGAPPEFGRRAAARRTHTASREFLGAPPARRARAAAVREFAGPGAASRRPAATMSSAPAAGPSAPAAAVEAAPVSTREFGGAAGGEFG